MSPIGKYFEKLQQETKKINKMAEGGRKVGLRHKVIPIHKKLKIIRDISYYQAQNIHSEEIAGQETIQNYEKFVEIQIHIPGMEGAKQAGATKPGDEKKTDEKEKLNSDKKVAGNLGASVNTAKTNATMSDV